MFVDVWHGCPERACRRHRYCLAPQITCTNAKPRNLSEDEKARNIADVYKKLREVAVERGDL